MKPLGFFLLFAGWLIVLAALAMLPPGVSRGVFVLAGVAVEVMGLTLAMRAHPVMHGGQE